MLEGSNEPGTIKPILPTLRQDAIILVPQVCQLQETPPTCPSSPCRMAVTTTTTRARLLRRAERSKSKHAAFSCATRPANKNINWTMLTRGEAVDEHVQWESATNRFPVPWASAANVSRAAPGRGAEQGKELKVGSSLHTSLAAAQVRDVFAKGESRVCGTHVRILGSVRASLERGNLVRGKSSGGTSWSSRDVLRLRAAARKTARNITCLKRKKKGTKKIKKLRSADQGLVFLSPAVKENCCQKYKYLSSLWQRGSKWLLLPATEKSSAARCKPEGFASNPELGTLSGAEIPLLGFPSTRRIRHGPNFDAPNHPSPFPYGSLPPGPGRRVAGGEPARRGAEPPSSAAFCATASSSWKQAISA